MRLKFSLIVLLIALFGVPFPVFANPGLLYELVHPDTPHPGTMPMTTEELFLVTGNSVELIDGVKEIPTLVVLLEYQDRDHRPIHSEPYWQDLVFGDPRTLTTVRPSVSEVIRESSNGRFVLVPALDGDIFDGDQDGVIGWVRSVHRTGAAHWTQDGIYDEGPMRGRAEGVIAADPFFDFSLYDQPKRNVDGSTSPPDGIVRGDELAIIVVFADNLSIQECGNRRIDPGEVCDDGNRDSGDGCSTNCFIETLCGNSQINWTEECDDGNNVNGDGCSADCSVEGMCGNGSLETGEECDDGNSINGDGCSSLCIKELNCDQHHNHPNTNLPSGTTNCQWTAAGNTRYVYDGDNEIEVDGVSVSQFVAGVSEVASENVVIHELGHSIFGLPDLYYECSGSARQNVADGYICNNDPSDWYPPEPGVYSTMAAYQDSNPPQSGFKTHFSPWSKIHLGFVDPVIVTHDGTYAVHGAETERTLSQQQTTPEALVVFDPLKGLDHYFILENRNITGLGAGDTDSGLAIWRIDEEQSRYRHSIQFLERGGYNVADSVALWDGADTFPDYYDFGPVSQPRNSEWSDGTASFVEVYDISEASETITFKVRMTPLFVDKANNGTVRGTYEQPFDTIQEAVNAIPENPRTISITPGFYPGRHVINDPLSLQVTGDGSVIIGE